MKKTLGEAKVKLLRMSVGLHALMAGVQLKQKHLSWLRKHEQQRIDELKKQGYLVFDLLPKEKWQTFSDAVQGYFKAFGSRHESGVDWAVNKRVYLDIEKSPDVSEIVNDILKSSTFTDQINKIVGSGDWDLYSVQIWRNYPEEFNKDKETNSTFYHVDNGGPKENRLLINVFMYLTPIKPENGPFTFYDKPTSHKINKHFFKAIMKYGNLRKYHLTKEIERFASPIQLLQSEGKALIINNQECMHRAGFCSKGHRDIIEFIIQQKSK